MSTVVLLGTLDTKGTEYGYLRDRLRLAGVDTLLVDVGTAARRRSSPTSRATRWPRGPASSSPGSTIAAPRSSAMADAAVVTRPAPARRGAARRAARRGRLGRHGDRHAGDARAAGRRAEAHGLDRRGGRHARVRRRGRPHADGVGDRRRGRELDLGPHPRQRGGRDGRDGRRAAGRARRAAAADRRDDVRGHDAVRRPPRARRSRRAATRCSSSTPRARAAGRWRGSCARGSWPGCWTRRRPSCATSSWAACSRRARTGSRRPARAGLPQVVSLGALDMVNFGAARHRSGALRRPHALRAQPAGHAHAHDARGVRRARAPDRPQALGGDRPRGALRAARGACR